MHACMHISQACSVVLHCRRSNTPWGAKRNHVLCAGAVALARYVRIVQTLGFSLIPFAKFIGASLAINAAQCIRAMKRHLAMVKKQYEHFNVRGPTSLRPYLPLAAAVTDPPGSSLPALDDEKCPDNVPALNDVQHLGVWRTRNNGLEWRDSMLLAAARPLHWTVTA
jgi:hypothetical protein